MRRWTPIRRRACSSAPPIWRPIGKRRCTALRDEPNVIDIRNLGLVGAIELEPIAGHPVKRAFDIFLKCYEAGALIRTTGDTLALTPPLIIEQAEIDQLVETIREALRSTE